MIRDGPRRDDRREERITTEGPVYTVTGGDWDTFLPTSEHDDRIVVNMGPQHPSTHGVLRLVLELEGETVTQARSVIGYLHTGIEKNCEYRTWTQGVTFVTRIDYLAPLFNETAYCLAVEKLLGVEVPRARAGRPGAADGAQPDRLAPGGLATGGMELGALTGMTAGFREREEVLHLLEFLTGPADEPRVHPARRAGAGLPRRAAVENVTDLIKVMRVAAAGLRQAAHRPADLAAAGCEGVGYLPLDGCLALGVTGPILRCAGPAVGPAQDRAVLRLRGLRLRGADGDRGRLLRPLPPAGRGDARVAQDHRAGRGDRWSPVR